MEGAGGGMGGRGSWYCYVQDPPLPWAREGAGLTLNALLQARPFVSTAKTKVETATIQMPINSAEIYDKRRKILESM